ncbi:hypothetical protein GGI04_005399, partial [Coemansia thaxteri]|uniref:Uncharacterized protein n=1 Tax=Coemansia thaxteri TaxID=2663907 RepID=A0A9W8BJY2_9FUNG
MGFCFSRPLVDDGNSEQAALLRDQDDAGTGTAERHSHEHLASMSTEELAYIKEAERLRALEQITTDALITISQRPDFAHAQTFSSNSGNSRDYTEVLRRFNQQIKLPMVSLAGPAEAARARAGAAGVDVMAILADGHIPDADIRIIDDAIFGILEVATDPHFSSTGDLVMSLSVSSDRL